MPKTKTLIKKFYKWRYKHISNSQFIAIASAIIGFLAGLGAVVLKNLTCLIQE